MEKISFILYFGLSVYLWNRYVVPFAVKKVVLMNSSNDWLKRQQDLIVRGFKPEFGVKLGLRPLINSGF